jgi:hypothetical protein
MSATIADPSKRELQVDGRRVDQAMRDVRAAFDARDDSHTHFDPRDWRDTAAMMMAERWGITPGDALVWDAASALLDLEGTPIHQEIRGALAELVRAVDHLLGENDPDAPWSMVRRVDAAYLAVGAAIVRWKGEA